MSTEINTQIQELPRLSKPELWALWQELFAQPSHPRLRRNLIVPILAYRLQEQAYGGLKPSTCKRLRQLGAELEQNPQLASSLLFLRISNEKRPCVHDWSSHRSVSTPRNREIGMPDVQSCRADFASHSLRHRIPFA